MNRFAMTTAIATGGGETSGEIDIRGNVGDPCGISPRLVSNKTPSR